MFFILFVLGIIETNILIITVVLVDIHYLWLLVIRLIPNSILNRFMVITNVMRRLFKVPKRVIKLFTDQFVPIKLLLKVLID